MARLSPRAARKTAPLKSLVIPGHGYDFSGGIVGKYAARFAAGTNAVLLDDDVAQVFPDSKSVNDALRALVKIADRRSKAQPKVKPGKR